MTKIALSITNLNKTYDNGFKALKDINLDIHEGEIFALLGPNGAGKTTLISTLCSTVNPTSGSISVFGLDHQKDYRAARKLIGVVPQELTSNAFEAVDDMIRLSRGLFGLPQDEELLNKILKDLTLFDKKKNMMMTLSGGMKRRVMIAKALAHQPKILFLDEPTAGVDVELRESLWELVANLKKSGVTIILTTHYIEEAEKMADRIGIINNGEINIVETKDKLMKQLGTKELVFSLKEDLAEIPAELSKYQLSLSGRTLTYTYDSNDHDEDEMAKLISKITALGLAFKDLKTKQSSLEDIFVKMVRKK